MDYELPDSSAAPEGEEELAEKGYNIVDPDLNKSLGNVAMAKDRYTEKCFIIKVSLTEEVNHEEKGSFRHDGPNGTKGAPGWEPSLDSGPGRDGCGLTQA